MSEVIGIRFKKCGKIYDYEVDSVDAKIGDTVVVESKMGLTIGNVVTNRRFIEHSDKNIKKILRLADKNDLEKQFENKKLAEEAESFCIESINSRSLDMKLVYTEVTLDKKRIIYYFTADGRIDFRELVKDLATKFKTRIEMRQIGVRDATKHIGGLGVCGREVCCNTFLSSFEPISIKMAKEQDITLNPEKLSGPCGRLKCCLMYECDRDVLTDGLVDSSEDISVSEAFTELDNAKEEDKDTDKHELKISDLHIEFHKKPKSDQKSEGKDLRRQNNIKKWRNKDRVRKRDRF